MSETAALSPPREPSRDPAFESVLRLIRERDRFVVTSHRNPEGDALGSSLGLGAALIEMGKQIVFYNADPVPRVLRPFPHADRIVNSLAEARRNDTVIVCDCGELERVGDEIVARREEFHFVNLDHHASSKGFAEVSYIDPEAPATSLLVYRILRGLDHPISADVATNLLCGLVTDTGSFRYSNATPEAFEAAAELTRRGARPDFVSQKLFDTQEEKTFRLLARVLESLELSAGGRIASVTVTRDMLEKTGTGAEHIEEFVNYPRRIEGVELAVLLREQGRDEWKVSLRGQGLIDTTAISGAYGGGGHRNASGCTVRAGLDAVKREIYARGEALLRRT
jgi:phosphoesterase RecJ-like protein